MNSSRNIVGIFATSISSNVNTGIDAVRYFSDARCRRIYRAACTMLPADEVAFVRASFCPLQSVSLTRCTVAQAWCSRILQSVETEHSTKSVIHGLERNEVICDARTARKALAFCLSA